MKKSIFRGLFLFAALICSLLGCQKESTPPPKDGNTILAGSGIPSFAVGKAGDFFMDTVGKVLWGPRNATNWGAGFALVGPTGIPGKSTISGAGAPATANGALGDFYIDITTKQLYGPKTAAGWGTPTNLVGTSGTNGTNGTNAQVIYSPWITSPYNSRDTTVDGTCLRVRHLNAPSLSSAILNQGVMITYMRVGSIGPYKLPYTSDAGGATNSINCIYNQQKIIVYRHTFNTCRFNSGIPEAFPGQPVLINLPQSLEYRYVLIPGLISGGSNRFTQNEEQILLKAIILPGQTNPVDLTTIPYTELCSILGINQ